MGLVRWSDWLVERIQMGDVGSGRWGREEGKEEDFWGDIGIEYGIRLVVMIELEKIVKMERKEEGYRDVVSKKYFL